MSCNDASFYGGLDLPGVSHIPSHLLLMSALYGRSVPELAGIHGRGQARILQLFPTCLSLGSSRRNLQEVSPWP